jgi:hypothetical protein
MDGIRLLELPCVALSKKVRASTLALLPLDRQLPCSGDDRHELVHYSSVSRSDRPDFSENVLPKISGALCLVGVEEGDEFVALGVIFSERHARLSHFHRRSGLH